MKAYWFEPRDGKLGYGDGRVPEVGVTHVLPDGFYPELCQKGFHGSRHVRDALSYAESTVCWQVVIAGDLQKGDDKVCGRSRTYLKRVDLRDTLILFACQCALEVAHLWEAPEEVLQFLRDPLNATPAAARAARAADAAAAAAYAARAADAAAAAAYAARAAARAAAAAAAAAFPACARRILSRHQNSLKKLRRSRQRSQGQTEDPLQESFDN